MAVVKRKLPVRLGKKGKPRASVAVGVLDDLTLPTERSTPSERFQDFATLLFGEKKIGKTDLTAQFDRTFHMMTEPGGKSLAIFQRAVNSWKEFQSYVRLLEKDKRYDTVAVDTADYLYGFCHDFTCQRMGMEHPADEAYGKGWAAIREEFTKWVRRLLATGKGVIFVSHATEREIKMRNGEKYDRISPTLAGQARDVLEGLVDIWAYYGYDGSDRILVIQGSDHIGAGHRLKQHFRHPTTGEPIAEISMGRSAEEGYQNLIDAFHNRYTPPSTTEEEKPKVAKKKLAFKKRK